MRLKFSITLALALAAMPAAEAQSFYHNGMTLFENGMYSQARALFEQAGDPLSEAYSVLCAAKERTAGYSDLIEAYLKSNPESILAPALHLQYGLNLFDEDRYDLAAREFDLAGADTIEEEFLPEYMFKRGYCHYLAGEYADAKSCFRKVSGMPYSQYTGPACYYTGYILYEEKQFAQAEDWFSRASEDPRFLEISSFYLVECRFMRGDYSYVIEKGVPLMETAPSERQSRLSRLISESYLVLGDKMKALEYYRKESAGKENLTRRRRAADRVPQ